MKLQEILDRQEAIRGELRRVEENPAAVEETDGDFVDTLVDEYETLESRRVPLAERAEKLKLIQRNAHSEDDVEKPEAPTIIKRSGIDPFDNLDAVRSRLVSRGELRSRALDVIERHNRSGLMCHDYAEAATTLAQDNPGVARHMLLTGSETYLDDFRAYLEDPEQNAQRAALSLTNANGGYLLPFVLDPTIVLTNAGSANPWRRISSIKQTTSNTWNGVTSAGVSAAWLAEATETTDNSPTVGNLAITPAKAAAWVFGSYEVLADTDFAQQLPALLQDAKDRLEEAAFATGTGTGQPQGVITGATTTVATTTTGAYVVADVYAAQQAVPARFRTSDKAAWVMNVAIINKTRQFDTAGGASFWTNLGKGAPETLLGLPVYESTTLSGVLTTTNKIAVVGDFGQYYIVDRVGVSLMYEPMVKGTAGNLPTGQAGWFMFWRVGAKVAVPGAFRVLLT